VSRRGSPEPAHGVAVHHPPGGGEEDAGQARLGNAADEAPREEEDGHREEGAHSGRHPRSRSSEAQEGGAGQARRCRERGRERAGELAQPWARISRLTSGRAPPARAVTASSSVPRSTIAEAGTRSCWRRDGSKDGQAPGASRGDGGPSRTRGKPLPSPVRASRPSRRRRRRRGGRPAPWAAGGGRGARAPPSLP